MARAFHTSQHMSLGRMRPIHEYRFFVLRFLLNDTTSSGVIVACTVEGFPPLVRRDLPPTMVPVYKLLSLSQRRCNNQQLSSNVTYPYSSISTV